MRALSTPTANAVAARSTAPGYLVQIGWTPTVRLSTLGDLTWNGAVWVAADIAVQGLRWAQAGTVTGTLRLGNSTAQYSAYALNQGVAGVAIRVWALDRNATATGDPVAVFDGEGGSLNLDEDAISIEIASRKARALKAPRVRIIAANGFSQLPVAGSTFRWGGQRYVLQRGR